jgi:5-methylcytosine-specific restriction endonuclease McrA
MRACLVCGKPILAGENKKTCSRSCANKNRSGINYKTGNRKNKVKYYKGLKIRLLELKGNSCERCGYNKQEILQIHHRDRNHSNNSIKNLELICPNCHFEEHFLEKSWLKNNKTGEVA